PRIRRGGWNRLLQRIGFPIERDGSDSIASHDRAVVATGFIKRVALFVAKRRHRQDDGESVGLFSLHGYALSGLSHVRTIAHRLTYSPGMILRASWRRKNPNNAAASTRVRAKQLSPNVGTRASFT